jgi:hypothetical protein
MRPCILYPFLGTPILGEILGPGEHEDCFRVRFPGQELSIVREWGERYLTEFSTLEEAKAALR